MGFESQIARRYMRAGKFFISVSTWITIIGVTLGVAVVCFVMSMHNGFESEIRSRLLGTTSHISIFPKQMSLMTEYRELVDSVSAIDGVVAVSPFIYYKAAVSTASAGDGIIVRGVDAELESKTSNAARDIIAGDFAFTYITEGSDSVSGIVLGTTLAQNLGVFLGESVFIYSIMGEELQRKAIPKVSKFYVSGIIETGMFEFDAQMAYISLQDAQKLFKTGDAATAIHLKLTDIYDAELMKPVIDSVLGYKYDVVPWYILHKNLFGWIAMEKKILFLGFILIVLVAAFSIISTLVMLTMEKRAEIGILKTIGCTPAGIRKIFVYNGLTIATVGVMAGWGLAAVAAYIQNSYKLISLPPDIYFVSYVPIDMHLYDFALAGAVTFLICFLAALYPAHQAARLEVIDVLRQ